MGKAENRVTKSVREYLCGVHGAVLVRVQTGSFCIEKRFIRGAETGTADLIGVMKGIPLAVEIKTPTNKAGQSEGQIKFQERWESAGGMYLLARSVQDVETWVNKLKES